MHLCAFQTKMLWILSIFLISCSMCIPLYHFTSAFLQFLACFFQHFTWVKCTKNLFFIHSKRIQEISFYQIRQKTRDLCIFYYSEVDAIKNSFFYEFFIFFCMEMKCWFIEKFFQIKFASISIITFCGIENVWEDTDIFKMHNFLIFHWHYFGL